MALGFNLRLSTLLPLACWATLACAQPQASPDTELPAAFAWEDPSLFPKYCIWRELAPVDGAACWELIVFNHMRETISVSMINDQVIYAPHALRTHTERIAEQHALDEAGIILGDSPWCWVSSEGRVNYLVPPNYTQSFRVVFPIGSQWIEPEVQFSGSESGRILKVFGPPIAPGPVIAPPSVRLEVDSASWRHAAPDFFCRFIQPKAAWSAQAGWSIDRPSSQGWVPIDLKEPGLALIPKQGFLSAGYAVAAGEPLLVALYWPLRCLPVRATARVREADGWERSRAVYLPRYDCDDDECALCRYQDD
jgi:hypothetical protein